MGLIGVQIHRFCERFQYVTDLDAEFLKLLPNTLDKLPRCRAWQADDDPLIGLGNSSPVSRNALFDASFDHFDNVTTKKSQALLGHPEGLFSACTVWARSRNSSARATIGDRSNP